MILHVDRAWLLDVAAKSVPGDPEVTDYGTFAAAVARHADTVLDVPVYPSAQHRAAALFHQLLHVPGLEWANEQYAAAVTLAYLQISGERTEVEPRRVASFAQRAHAERLTVREVAAEIKSWCAETT